MYEFRLPACLRLIACHSRTMSSQRKKKKPKKLQDGDEGDEQTLGEDGEEDADNVQKLDDQQSVTANEKLDALLAGQNDLKLSFDQFKKQVSQQFTDITKRLDSVEQLATANTLASGKIKPLSDSLSELQTSCQFISNKYDELTKGMDKKIKEIVEKENKEYVKQNEILRKKVKTLETDVDTEKRIRVKDQQYSNNNKLEISGIPFVEGQHTMSDCCKNLVVDVSAAAGVEMSFSDVDVAHRLPKSVNTVIVQFSSRTARNRLWFGKRGLKGKTVECLGLPKPEHNAGYIFVNEQLSPYNKMLLQEVKKQCDYVGIERKCVFTKKGVIHVNAPHFRKILPVVYRADIDNIY